MDQKIKRSVATLLAHIVKIDNRDIKKRSLPFLFIDGTKF